MKEAAIYLVMWVTMLLNACGFFLIFDQNEKLKTQIDALQVVVQNNTEGFEQNKKEITDELKFTNSICEKVLSGEW